MDNRMSEEIQSSKNNVPNSFGLSVWCMGLLHCSFIVSVCLRIYTYSSEVASMSDPSFVKEMLIILLVGLQIVFSVFIWLFHVFKNLYYRSKDKPVTQMTSIVKRTILSPIITIIIFVLVSALFPISFTMEL